MGVCEVGTLGCGDVGGDIELGFGACGTRGCRFAKGLKWDENEVTSGGPEWWGERVTG